MDRIQGKLIIAITSRLSAAQDSDAKTELIEELSDNLYQRYLDLTAQGVGEEEAYQRALEDLGDVDELLAYLRGLSQAGEASAQEKRQNDFFNDLAKNAEEIVRETISQTKGAVDQAKIIVQDVAKKLKEKYPHGFEGGVHFHIDSEDDDHGEHPEGEACEDGDVSDKSGKDFRFSMGYSKDRGGFFCETGKSQPVSGTEFPSQPLKQISVRLCNGDVAVHLLDDSQAAVRLAGDTESFEVRLDERGLLSITQGKTASSSFLFGRGLAAADLELYLPRRYWEAVYLTTANGDVALDDGLEAGKLNIKTASGDIAFRAAVCPQMVCKSASGDVRCRELTGAIQAESLSGDVAVNGCLDSLRASSMSGDICVSGSIQNAHCTSASGDIDLETDVPPAAVELSSKSGDCTISLPENEGFVLDYHTVSGGLSSDFPLTMPVGAPSGTAFYLNGGERTYRVSCFSGDIRLIRQ